MGVSATISVNSGNFNASIVFMNASASIPLLDLRNTKISVFNFGLPSGGGGSGSGGGNTKQPGGSEPRPGRLARPIQRGRKYTRGKFHGAQNRFAKIFPGLNTCAMKGAKRFQVGKARMQKLLPNFHVQKVNRIYKNSKLFKNFRQKVVRNPIAKYRKEYMEGYVKTGIRVDELEPDGMPLRDPLGIPSGSNGQQFSP